MNNYINKYFYYIDFIKLTVLYIYTIEDLKWDKILFKIGTDINHFYQKTMFAKYHFRNSIVLFLLRFPVVYFVVFVCFQVLSYIFL